MIKILCNFEIQTDTNSFNGKDLSNSLSQLFFHNDGFSIR